jgi:hypothetical protein
MELVGERFSLGPTHPRVDRVSAYLLGQRDFDETRTLQVYHASAMWFQCVTPNAAYLMIHTACNPELPESS